MLKAIIFGAASAGWLTAVVFVAAAGGDPPLSDSDKAFLTSAAILTNYELKAIAIAERVAPSDSDGAQSLKIEASKFASDVKSIADRSNTGFRLPTGIDPAHARLLARLQNCRTTFPAEYARQMAASHLAMQALYRDYLRRHDVNHRLEAVIISALPTVATHLHADQSLAER